MYPNFNADILLLVDRAVLGIWGAMKTEELQQSSAGDIHAVQGISEVSFELRLFHNPMPIYSQASKCSQTGPANHECLILTFASGEQVAERGERVEDEHLGTAAGTALVEVCT